MASHDRSTDDSEVQRPKELTVMGRKREKLSVHSLHSRWKHKEAWQKL
jgi:hypothetical protein